MNGSRGSTQLSRRSLSEMWLGRGRRSFTMIALLGLAAVFAGGLRWAEREWRFRGHLRAARIALDRFMANDAALELAAAQKFKPYSAEMHYLLGVASRKTGQLDEGASHFDKALELGWPPNEIRFQRLLLAFQAGDHRSEPVIRRIISLPMADDLAEDAYEALAIGYLSEYRTEEAGTSVDRWLRLRPGRVRAMLLRADVLRASGGRVHQQLQQYEQILAIDPDNYAAHLGMALALLDIHDVKRALQAYLWCAERKPGDVTAPLGAAECYKHLGEMENAAGVLRGLLEHSLPSEARARVTGELGKLLDQTGDLEEAVALLTESVELNPYDEETQYTLAMGLAKIGKTDAAERHKRRFQELDELKRKIHDLRSIIFIQPDDAQPRYEAGLLLAKIGKFDAAAAMMSAVLRRDPGHAGAQAELAKYYGKSVRGEHGLMETGVASAAPGVN